jgi:short chain dehydrogenase
MKRFEDKTILVTGAGSGIGAACVRRLFAEGASIVSGDVRKEEVDKVVSEFGNSERIFGVGVDVSDRDQVATFVSEAVRRFGKLYGLVNSAGIRGVGNVLDTDPEVWRKVLSVNLEGTFHVPGFRLRSEQGANACRNREPQLCGRDQGRAQPPPVFRVEVRGRRDHPDDGIGTRTVRRPCKCRCARDDPYAADSGHVPGPRKCEADSRRSSHWSRRSARGGGGSYCLPPV